MIGDLVYAEQVDWMPRVRTILEQGESRAFEPFDRTGQLRVSKGKTLADLLDAFAEVRNENIDALRALNLSTADFDRRGRHPSLGTVTLS